MSHQREDFEEAAARMGYNLTMAEHETGEYHYPATQDAWDMWQECCDKAARESEPGWTDRLNTCKHHGDDHEACAVYGGRVPCDAEGGEAVEIGEILHDYGRASVRWTINPKYGQFEPGAKVFVGHPPKQQSEVPDFDYSHPQYCEIIEKITGATHDLLEAAGHDAEYLLDMDEAIEANIYKNIVMVATEISGSSPQPDKWIPCSEKMQAELVEMFEHGDSADHYNVLRDLINEAGLTRPTPPEQESE